MKKMALLSHFFIEMIIFLFGLNGFLLNLYNQKNQLIHLMKTNTLKRIALVSAAALLTCSAAFGAKKAPKIDVAKALSGYFTPATDEAATPDSKGFIRRWLLLEPISKPNRSNTVFTDSYIREAFSKEYYEGQFTTLPTDGQKVKVMVEDQPPVNLSGGRPSFNAAPAEPVFKKETLTWYALDSKLFNVKIFRFATCLDKTRYGVIFEAWTVIDAPEDMEVRLAVGSNSASMWWLNGEEAVILSGDRRMVADDCVSKRLTLKQGKNYLRGSIINGPGMSDFCVRFIDEAGNPVKNLKVYTK